MATARKHALQATHVVAFELVAADLAGLKRLAASLERLSPAACAELEARIERLKGAFASLAVPVPDLPPELPN